MSLFNCLLKSKCPYCVERKSTFLSYNIIPKGWQQLWYHELLDTAERVHLMIYQKHWNKWAKACWNICARISMSRRSKVLHVASYFIFYFHNDEGHSIARGKRTQAGHISCSQWYGVIKKTVAWCIKYQCAVHCKFLLYFGLLLWIEPRYKYCSL